MMKRILFSLVSCLMAMGAWAVETTDYIKLSAAETVVPGGDAVKLTVSLVGSTNYYTAYNMDIHLPEGMSVDYKNNKPRVAISASSRTASAFYPSTEEEEDEGTVYRYTHSVTCSYGVIGDRVLRVACISTSNEVFKAVSGDLFTIYVKASAYAKPGAAQITIDGVALKVAGGSEYDPASRVDENVTVGTASSVSCTVSSGNKYSTLVLPFDASLPTGMKAYTCESYADDMVSLKEASSLAAYTPYVVYAEGGYSGTLSGTVDAGKYVEVATEGLLNGAIVPQQKSTGYVLQKLSEGVMFYNMNSQVFSIPSGKCWLEIPAAVKSVGLSFDDPAAIGSLSSECDVTASQTVFDLQGRKVSRMEAGKIYIINGNKFLKLK